MFDLEFLANTAKEQFGLSDFGDPLYLSGLQELTRAIEAEAEIAPERVLRTAMQLIMLLGARAKIAETLARHPEIEAEPVEAPVFITGLLRTGTTMLHNVLSGHPDLRAPLLWEMRAVGRPENADSSWEEQAIQESRAMIDLLYESIPEFARIHPMDALRPDECSWLFRHNFATLVYAFTYHIPGYVRWLTQIDMEPYYQYYKKLLQILQWKKPKKRWVLKDPCHLWHLDALLRVFPDAKVIVLHRTLKEALPSMASLCFSLHRFESGREDPRLLADYCMDLAERGLFSMMRLRRVFPQHHFLDIPYRKLVADPAGMVKEICANIGSPAGEEALAGMLGWLEQNRQHKAGRHIYSLEQFGFEAQTLGARFGRYQEAFLPEEPLVVYE